MPKTSEDTCVQRSVSISGVNRCQSSLNLIVGDSRLGRLRRANKRSNIIYPEKRAGTPFRATKWARKRRGLRSPRVISSSMLLSASTLPRINRQSTPAFSSRASASFSLATGIGIEGRAKIAKVSRHRRQGSRQLLPRTLLKAPRRTHFDNSCTNP